MEDSWGGGGGSILEGGYPRAFPLYEPLPSMCNCIALLLFYADGNEGIV